MANGRGNSLYRWRKRTFSVFKELGIPGPEPNLIFGNLLEIWKEGMGPCSSKWLKQYGDVVGYYNGAMPGIVTRDRELIKRIFINDFQYFTGRQIMALVSKNLPVNEVRLSRVSGDDWRYLKNITIPAFKTNNIKKGFSIMHDCAQECLRLLDSKIAGSDGCVEVFQPFCNLASDFGLQFFAGTRTGVQRDDEAAHALCKAARQSVGQFGGAGLFLLNLLPDSPTMHKLLVRFRSIFTQLPSDEMLDRMLPIINHRRANPEGKLTYDNLAELTYLNQCLSESLRIYPALPGSVRRICDQDYEYNGVRILKGMNVSVPTLDVHYDPVLWPEPKKFDPER
ncbi:hypothetical protein MTO96_041773 [Rhipicephalus appendiculatus]